MDIKTINNVTITGVLVKNGLAEKEDKNGNEIIVGDLVLRTSDGSEHSVNYYARKYKKDSQELNKMYTSYETIMTDYVALDQIQEGEQADVVKIGYGSLTDNDFMYSDKMINNNKINAKFANRIEPSKIEANPQVAKFELNGVITKMDAEIIKDVPTGNYRVMLDAFNSYKNSDDTINLTIVPVKLLLDKSKVSAFQSAGFYEGACAKLTGNIVNTTQKETITEEQAFGDPIIKEITKTVKKYDITGGSPLASLTDLGLTQDLYETAKSKRRLKLDEVKNGKSNGGNGNSQTTTQQPSNNPFANPFAN